MDYSLINKILNNSNYYFSNNYFKFHNEVWVPCMCVQCMENYDTCWHPGLNTFNSCPVLTAGNQRYTPGYITSPFKNDARIMLKYNLHKKVYLEYTKKLKAIDDMKESIGWLDKTNKASND